MATSVKASPFLGRVHIHERRFDGIEVEHSRIADMDPAEAEALASQLIEAAFEARANLEKRRQNSIAFLRGEIEQKQSELDRLERDIP
jgi:hypothetical protein